MKKIFTILVLVCISTLAMAQPRSIGLRLGYYYDASYQHSVGNNFIEIDAGTWGFHQVHATAVYDFIFASPDWASKGQFNWYAGPGIGAGYNYWSSYYGYNSFNVGLVGQVGLEYQFWFPLIVSFDYRPMIGVDFYNGGTHFYRSLYDGAFSVRYKF